MKKIKYILICGLTAALAAGCTMNFEEINTNPNRTVVGVIPAYSMFQPLIYNGANAWLNYTHFWNNELIQFTAHTGGTTRQEHMYQISDQNFEQVWSLYARYGNNADHMQELAVRHGDRAAEAVAITIKVLFMYNLTDMYGDIPYQEAFTGRKVGGTKTPKFDSQKSVYEQMFAELEHANELYSNNPQFQRASLDGLYNGSMPGWRKFNNSLYLRLLTRVSGRSDIGATAKIGEIIANPDKYPIFESNADNARIDYSGDGAFRSQFADTEESTFTATGRKLTQQLIKMTVIGAGTSAQTYVDPRLPIYGKKNPYANVNPDNIWIGTVAGINQQDRPVVDRGTSWLNAAVFCRPTAPGFFMDYAEVLFIKAEAALKGWIPGGAAQAKSYYEAAIAASCEKWSEFGQYSETPVSISAADIRALLDSDLANWDRAANKEELIANQKYLALFFIGMEAYHEYRRTGYPVLTIGDGALNDGILPTRFAYCIVTTGTNGANVREALTRMGGENDMKTPVWWSRKAIQGN